MRLGGGRREDGRLFKRRSGNDEVGWVVVVGLRSG